MITFLAGWFDGASQRGMCGCGAFLKPDNIILYYLHQNGGLGTNTRAKIMALWGLLQFAAEKQLDITKIYGDSKVIIDGMLGHTSFGPPLQVGWTNKVRHLLASLTSFSISHILRENKKDAYRLSKDGLLDQFRIIHYTLSVDRHIRKVGEIHIP